MIERLGRDYIPVVNDI